MAKKKKSTVPVTHGTLTTSTSIGNWVISSSGVSVSGLSGMCILSQGVHDLRSHLFKVDIGDYDTSLVTALLRGVEFEEERIVISFLLDDKDTVREAFSEYHYFRLYYLDKKGNEV
jgi:hypothetical protein